MKMEKSIEVSISWYDRSSESDLFFQHLFIVLKGKHWIYAIKLTVLGCSSGISYTIII